MHFNNRGVGTENNWSPYQMWLNGMIHEDNPLAHALLDEDPNELVFYGYDPEGPSPFEDSDNNVVVPPVDLDDAPVLSVEVLQVLGPLRSSTQMGINVFTEALYLVEERVAAQNVTGNQRSAQI